MGGESMGAGGSESRRDERDRPPRGSAPEQPGEQPGERPGDRPGDESRRSRRRGRRRSRSPGQGEPTRPRPAPGRGQPPADTPFAERAQDDPRQDLPEAEVIAAPEDAPVPSGSPAPDEDAGPLVHVAFRGGRVEAYANPREIELRDGDRVIVEAERGIDYGRIVACQGPDLKRRKGQPLRAVVRHATEEETARLATIIAEDHEAFEICRSRAAHFRLEMKVIDAETQFDGNRVTFYFTADHRVDFRELVRDLAGIFRTRIELRQVGARDAARRCDGMGICGRPLCCNSFLREFEPVTLKMAKEQNLALNPAKISGACGRLMCCLTYECAAYQRASKQAPGLGSRWVIAGQTVTVRIRDVGNHRVFVENDGGQLAAADLDLFAGGQARPAPRVEPPGDGAPADGDEPAAAGEAPAGPSGPKG